MEEGSVEDVPIIEHLSNYQKWIGLGLIFVGGYYLFIDVFLPMIEEYIPEDFVYHFKMYSQVVIVSILLIGFGIKLLFGKKEVTK